MGQVLVVLGPAVAGLAVTGLVFLSLEALG